MTKPKFTTVIRQAEAGNVKALCTYFRSGRMLTLKHKQALADWVERTNAKPTKPRTLVQQAQDFAIIKYRWEVAKWDRVKPKRSLSHSKRRNMLKQAIADAERLSGLTFGFLKPGREIYTGYDRIKEVLHSGRFPKTSRFPLIDKTKKQP